MNKHRSLKNGFTSAKQGGAVLIVSMVILVALTMLGVTSMKSALTELTMAGNMRESGLTFQASEAGLVFAENFIENSISKTIFNGTVSLLSKGDIDPDYLDLATWVAATEATLSLENIQNNPKYIIHYLGDEEPDPNVKLAIEGYGGTARQKVSNFRVTSRGLGQTGNYFKVVQSYYGKEY